MQAEVTETVLNGQERVPGKPRSNPFALNIRFHLDAADDGLRACDTNDTCPPTCASACVTGEGF